jgi:acetyl-CoA carboxylase carboxyl transferase subunit alpha
VIAEPLGGAHAAPEEMAESIKSYLLETLPALQKQTAEQRIEQRIEKFSKMGFYDEVSE